MFVKVGLVFFLLYNVQGKVIKNSPTIDQLRGAVDSARTVANMGLRSADRQVRDTISTARTNLTGIAKEFEKLVTSSDNPRCIREVSRNIERIKDDVDSLRKCNNLNILTMTRNNIRAEFTKIEEKINRLDANCLRKDDPAEIEKCILNGSGAINKQIVAAGALSNTTIENFIKRANKCISNVESATKSEVDKATRDLQMCLAETDAQAETSNNAGTGNGIQQDTSTIPEQPKDVDTPTNEETGDEAAVPADENEQGEDVIPPSETTSGDAVPADNSANNDGTI